MSSVITSYEHSTSVKDQLGDDDDDDRPFRYSLLVPMYSEILYGRPPSQLW